MTEYSYKYYDPLEQMMPIRHQYISQIIKRNENLDLNKYLKEKSILDLGCGTGSFLSNYEKIANNCTGVDTLDFFSKKQSPRLKFINLSVSPDIAERTTITLFFFDQVEIIEADLLIASILPTEVPPNFKTLTFISCDNIHISIIM